jgi:hypothetical protein
MTIVLHIMQAVFALYGVSLFWTFLDSKHFGVLLGGIVFFSAASWSFHLGAWWPLGVGFVVAWGLRLLGLDPGARS